MATIETERHTGRHARGWAVVEEAAALLPGGELPAAIFNDEDIYAIESERIFARSWVYLAHESEIPDRGDYVLRYIARSPFVVPRDEDGDVHALLDQCRHFHLDEDRASLEMRVERVETGYAWAEDPPSRLRHFVTNVRAEAAEDADGELAVRSNVLVYRSRWDRPGHDLLSGERQDVLRADEDGWRLARRLVVLDSTTLPTLNLSFFF